MPPFTARIPYVPPLTAAAFTVRLVVAVPFATQMPANPPWTGPAAITDVRPAPSLIVRIPVPAAVTVAASIVKLVVEEMLRAAMPSPMADETAPVATIAVDPLPPL